MKVKITCPYCRAIIYPEPHEYGRMIKCICGKMVKVSKLFANRIKHQIDANGKTEIPDADSFVEVEKKTDEQQGQVKENAIAIPDSQKIANISGDRKVKSCPFCGEEILEVARKCKHCGEIIDPVIIKAQAQTAITIAQNQALVPRRRFIRSFLSRSSARLFNIQPKRVNIFATISLVFGTISTLPLIAVMIGIAGKNWWLVGGGAIFFVAVGNCLSFFGLIFSIVAFFQLNKNPNQIGWGRAIFGFILNLIAWIVILLITFGFGLLGIIL